MKPVEEEQAGGIKRALRVLSMPVKGRGNNRACSGGNNEPLQNLQRHEHGPAERLTAPVKGWLRGARH